MLNQPVKKF